MVANQRSTAMKRVRGNHGAEFKAKVAVARCSPHSSRLRLIRMPSYCPELNPDEWLNQDVKTNGLGKSRPTKSDRPHRHYAQPCISVYRRQKRPQVITNLFREKHVHDANR
jgi:hypothetical protein